MFWTVLSVIASLAAITVGLFVLAFVVKVIAAAIVDYTDWRKTVKDGRNAVREDDQPEPQVQTQTVEPLSWGDYMRGWSSTNPPPSKRCR